MGIRWSKLVGQVSAERPELFLIDSKMAEKTRLATLKSIRRDLPAWPILFLTPSQPSAVMLLIPASCASQEVF